MTLPAHNVADLFRHAAQATPDAIALRFPRGTGAEAGWDELTFAELDAESDRLARGFVREGLTGMRVLLAVRPGPGFYATSFGLLRAGATPVFLDPGMDRRMMLQCVERLGPDALIGIPPAVIARSVLRKTFRSVRKTITAGRFGLGGPTLVQCRRLGFDPTTPLPSVSEDDDAVLVFTSGSTGRPKAVALPHRTMIARVRQIRELVGLRPGDTVVETLLVYTVLELCMGCSVVVPPMDVAKPAAVDPAAVLGTIERFEPRLVSASPIVWQRLARHALDIGAHPHGVEMLLTTAAPIPVDLHRRLRSVFGDHVELLTPYGATEAMPVAMIGTGAILAETGMRTAEGEGVCVGTVAKGMELAILEVSDDPVVDEDAMVRLPTGRTGEIVVRGGGVSPTYVQDADANARSKIPATTPGRDAWHRMGDLGRLDGSGRLWFSGRVGHRLRTADGMVPAVDVEGVFNAHEAVFRSGLVGVGAPGQEVPVLCVELEAGLEATDALKDDILGMADGTRWEGLVQRVLFHPGFPVDTRHNSKIRREDLKEWVASRPG